MATAAPAGSKIERPGDKEVAFNRPLFILSLGLFFLWGFATVLIDILVPKLKGLFDLSFAEVMLTQFAFFLGYLVFSLPAGNIVARIGYMRGIVLGLTIMAAGCLMFAPAARMGLFAGFLFALFIMAAGITTLQVAANAVIAIIGPAETGSARLTLAQAFNSFGTFIGPLIGASLILQNDVNLPADIATLSAAKLSALRISEASVVQVPFLGIAALLVVLIVVFWVKRDLLPHAAPDAASHGGIGFALLRRPRILFGVISIFAYVGAEVSIGSMMANYLMQPDVLSLTALRAGQLVSIYWGGAMVGRFIGAAVLHRIRPGRVLSVCASGAIILAALSSFSHGYMAGGTILAVGLMNSIMFPTIFALSLEGTGEDAPRASALLCMGIVGGAILPVVTGSVADHLSLATALIVPIIAYGWIIFFGQFTVRASRLRP